MSLLKLFYNRIEPSEKGTFASGPETKGLSTDESIRPASEVESPQSIGKNPSLSSRYTPRTLNIWAFSLLCGKIRFLYVYVTN